MYYSMILQTQTLTSPTARCLPSARLQHTTWLADEAGLEAWDPTWLPTHWGDRGKVSSLLWASVSLFVKSCYGAVFSTVAEGRPIMLWRQKVTGKEKEQENKVAGALYLGVSGKKNAGERNAARHQVSKLWLFLQLCWVLRGDGALPVPKCQINAEAGSFQTTLEDDLQTWSDAAGPCSDLPVALPQALSHSGSLLLQSQQENPSFQSTNDIMSYII